MSGAVWRDGALVLAVLLAYANAWRGLFQFDDLLVIVNNPVVHGWSAWWADQPGMRPLLKLSYLINWRDSADVAPFHAVNLAIHAVNTVLVHRLVRALPSPTPAATNGLAAWWVALCFAVHPAQTEAVTYLSGRSMSLMAAFTLIAIACYERGARDPARRGWWVGVPLAYVAAPSVKETAIGLPLCLVAWAFLRGEGWRDLRDRVPVVAGVCLVALAGIGAMSIVPGYRRALLQTSAGLDPLDVLVTQTQALGWLSTRVLVPWRQSIDPDWRGVEGQVAWAMVSVVGLGLLAWLGWQQRRTDRWLLGGLLWTLACLAPGQTWLVRWDIANERHAYLANAGVLMVLVAAWRAATQGRVGGVLRRHPVWVWSSAAALVLGLVALTWHRNADYHSEIGFWQAAARASPDKPRVLNNLGYAYARAGRFEEARVAYRAALARDPGFARARANLAEIDF